MGGLIMENSTAFRKVCVPGENMFCIWGIIYAPPMDGIPAQTFFGEWTGTSNGADIIMVEPDSGRQEIIGFDGIDTTQCFCPDPYRPVIWLSDRKNLVEIDRRTLKPRKVCDLPMQAAIDIDKQGRLWFSQTRKLTCFDPRTNELTVYPDVTPDEYYYAEGTHMRHGVGPDGRIWMSQDPIMCLMVFDPQTKKTKVVWGEPGKSHDPRERETGVESKDKAKKRWPGMPVVIGNLVWAGEIFADATTAELVEPPFPVTGENAFHLVWRGGWNRTPTAHLDRGGRALAMQKRKFGWLDVATGKFELIGELPPGVEPQNGWLLHGKHTLISGEAQGREMVVADLKKQTVTRSELKGPYKHPQAMFEWNVGPDGNFYGSCYSHEMWQVDRQGNFKNHGDIVRVHGGELHAFANWKNKMFVASYTHSVITRIDVTRPIDNWGTEAENNPRHVLNLLKGHEGQHRPSALAVTPKGHLYFISRADYCTRREGVLAIIDCETEKVLHIEDPLVKGEQLWGLAVSPTRNEAYIGTNRGTFVVWDTEAMKIKRTIKLEPRPGDGQMTSAMSEIGTLKFIGAVGDLVIGNLFGGAYEVYVYHADTGVMDLPKPHPLGKVFGIFQWQKRKSVLLYILGGLYEFDSTGQTKTVYEPTLPGFSTKEGPDGRLYLQAGLAIHEEIDPAWKRLQGTL